MKKILFLIWNTKKCGGNKVILEYAKRLKEKEKEVTIFSICGGKADWFDSCIKITNIFSGEIFRKHDCLIATFWPTSYLLWLLPSLKKYYLVLGLETKYYKNILLLWAVYLSLKFPFQKIVISRFLLDEVKKINGKLSDYLPVSISSIYSPSLTRTFPVKKKNKHRILSVISSYQRYKGIDILVNIIQYIKKEHPGDFHFVLVSFEKKPFSDDFDEFISGISDQGLAQEYQKADLFLSASRVEGFFLPGLEAMACGCPVVMTESGGIQEYAVNNENCLLFNNSEEEAEKAVLNVVRNKPLRTKMVKNGLITAKNYSWDKSVSRFLKIIS